MPGHESWISSIFGIVVEKLGGKRSRPDEHIYQTGRGDTDSTQDAAEKANENPNMVEPKTSHDDDNGSEPPLKRPRVERAPTPPKPDRPSRPLTDGGTTLTSGTPEKQRISMRPDWRVPIPAKNGKEYVMCRTPTPTRSASKVFSSGGSGARSRTALRAADMATPRLPPNAFQISPGSAPRMATTPSSTPGSARRFHIPTAPLTPVKTPYTPRLSPRSTPVTPVMQHSGRQGSVEQRRSEGGPEEGAPVACSPATQHGSAASTMPKMFHDSAHQAAMARFLKPQVMTHLRAQYEEKVAYFSELKRLEEKDRAAQEAMHRRIDEHAAALAAELARTEEERKRLEDDDDDEEEDYDSDALTEEDSGSQGDGDVSRDDLAMFARPSKDYPLLTKNMALKVLNSWEGNPKDTLVDVYNTVISREMFRCTRDGEWLNSEVAQVWLSTWADHIKGSPGRYRDTHIFSTFFYSKLTSAPGGQGVGPKYNYTGVRRWTKKVDIFAKELLLIPMHLGVHWVLMTVDFVEKSMRYYDSMHGSPGRAFDHLKQYLQDEHANKKGGGFEFTEWAFQAPKNIPEQRNGNDCGYFMMHFARCLCEKRSLDFEQRHFPYIRRRVGYEVLEQSIVD